MNVIYVKRFHGTGKICSMYSLNKNYNEIKNMWARVGWVNMK